MEMLFLVVRFELLTLNLINMKRLIYLFAVIGFISLNSCKTASIVQTSNEKYEQTNPNSIEIFLSKKPDRDYDEIGKVSSDKYNGFGIAKKSEVKIQEDLKKKAASIGGNAIINVTEDFASISGIVIRYR